MMMRAKMFKYLLATAVVLSFGLMSSSRSAEAGWGHWHRHHRSFHYGFHYGWGWPRYSFSYYPTYSFYRPVYYRSYYAPRYYVAPVVGYNCVYPSAWGWGGFYSSNSQTAPLTAPVTAIASSSATVAPPAVQPPVVASPVARSIALSVNVPEDARVTINENATEASGNIRDFVAHAADPSKEYEFVVRAEVERGGQLLTETKTVVLKAGQNSKIDFAMQSEPTLVAQTDDAQADDPVETVLTMQVPDEARVYLSGIEMKQTGNTRVFKTSQLKPGQELAGYAIRVEMPGEVAGSIEREVTLVGGQSQEIDLIFESTARLAAK